MARIRLNDEDLKLLQREARPGETPGECLNRLLRELRVNRDTELPGAGLNYQELAQYWRKSVPWVKALAMEYRKSGGKRGLGPVRRLGHKSVLVPWETIRAYEEGGVW